MRILKSKHLFNRERSRRRGRPIAKVTHRGRPSSRLLKGSMSDSSELDEGHRRFPPPWTVEQIPGGYKVKDANGQSLAYVYGRETRADADIAHVLTMDEARRIASNIAKLPIFLMAQPRSNRWLSGLSPRPT